MISWYQTTKTISNLYDRTFPILCLILFLGHKLLGLVLIQKYSLDLERYRVVNSLRKANHFVILFLRLTSSCLQSFNLQ